MAAKMNVQGMMNELECGENETNHGLPSPVAGSAAARAPAAAAG